MARAAPPDRYELHVTLDPAHTQMAVSGAITFPRPVPASAESLRLSLGRGMTPPSFEPMGASSPQPAARWTVVDSTDDDYIWSASSPGSGPVSGVRFNYVVSSPEPRYLFYLGREYAFAAAGSHSWYPRRPDTRARGEIAFEFPAGWTLVSGGVRAEDAPGRARFAASFGSELWFVAGPFSTYRLDGPIPVTVYSTSPGIRASLLAQRTSRTLDVLRGLFGTFPYPGLSLIEVPPEVAKRAGGFNGVGAAGAIAFWSGGWARASARCGPSGSIAVAPHAGKSAGRRAKPGSPA